MAETIYRRMKRKGMILRRLPFILGSLAPDIYFSFIFRRHEYDCSAASVKKTIFRLHEGRFDPRSALFAYLAGVVTHYICDYFCYSHSPSFPGNLWDHIKYEWVQRMGVSRKNDFRGEEGDAACFYRLMDTLDKNIRKHDRDLAFDAAASRADIATGMAAALRITEAVFCSAEQRFTLPVIRDAVSSAPSRLLEGEAAL
jgi:hypothetical protein